MNPLSFKGNVEFKVLYFSDVHANTKNIPSFKTAVDKFDKQNEGKRTLKLAGGDLNNATDLGPNVLFIKLMNLIGLDASAIGNHEIEGGNYWAEAIEKAKPKFKFLSANLNFTRPNEIENKIAKSTIIERKGEKVGVIGVTAFDSIELNFKGDFNNFVEVNEFNETAKAVKEEIKKLEKKGINKIFLLAHTGKTSKKGFEYYEHLAKIGGIDVIIGGHDHIERNLWYKSSRKDLSGTPEPVKVVSTRAENDKDKGSEDLDTFGVFKAVFNDKGVLISDKCKNTIKSTKKEPASKEVVKILEDYKRVDEKVIGHTNIELKCENKKTEENPVADLLADSMLWIANEISPKSNVQIALINSGEIKGDLPKGDITINDVKEAFPFTHNVTIIETTLTKKQIIDALNWGVKTTTFSKMTTGLLQVGGISYTVGNDNKVKNIHLLNKDGSLSECLDDMPDDKEYKVVYDTYLMKGAAGMDSLKKDPNDPNVKIYPYHHQNGVIKYLKENFKDKPIEIKTGRIEIEPKTSKLKEPVLA